MSKSSRTPTQQAANTNDSEFFDFYLLNSFIHLSFINQFQSVILVDMLTVLSWCWWSITRGIWSGIWPWSSSLTHPCSFFTCHSSMSHLHRPWNVVIWRQKNENVLLHLEAPAHSIPFHTVQIVVSCVRNSPLLPLPLVPFSLSLSLQPSSPLSKAQELMDNANCPFLHPLQPFTRSLHHQKVHMAQCMDRQFLVSLVPWGISCLNPYLHMVTSRVFRNNLIGQTI